MITRKVINTALFSILLVIPGILFSPYAFAFDQPSFPSCLNPQGSILAQFADGTHGVPGNTDTFTGSDSVFTLSSSVVMQCLCPLNGQGIQTNWMKTSELSDPEISILENQGWIYVPSGLVWGLEDVHYLAQNTNFSCQANAALAAAIVVTPSTSPAPTTSANSPGNNQTNTNNSSNNSNANSNNASGNQNSGNSSSSNSSSSPSVLGTNTQQVLGLASTGNIILLYTFLIAGTLFVGLGMLLRKPKL